MLRVDQIGGLALPCDAKERGFGDFGHSGVSGRERINMYLGSIRIISLFFPKITVIRDIYHLAVATVSTRI